MKYDLVNTPIEYLKGVGSVKATLLQKEFNIFKFEDLLYHYPFRYVDRTKFHKISEINNQSQNVQIIGKIIKIEELGINKGKRLVATFQDETGIIELVWFKGIRWLKSILKTKIPYIMFGKPTFFKGKINISHPELDIPNTTIKNFNGLQPIYSTTEKLTSKGLGSKGIEKIMKTLISQISNQIEETLTKEIIENNKLINKEQAIKNIHFPKNEKWLEAAQKRLKFEELFYLQIQILKSKENRIQKTKGLKFEKVGYSFNTFYNQYLEFELTNEQKKVIKEIRADVATGKQMNRLLQGDVGSGKTIVSIFIMLLAYDNHFQSAMIAPTEVLAIQHYKSISPYLSKLGLNVAILTGSTKASERKIIHEKLLSNKLQILVGTHALFEKTVQFNNLGLVVIDEQHRFGVAQKSKMWNKNKISPHILIMSATPIPRTLAMTFYGDLNISVINELPKNRKSIKTIHHYGNSKNKIYKFIGDEIEKGRQIYIVYPLIEESETLELKNLKEGYESICKAFPKYEIGMLHGKMKSDEKDFEINKFIKQKTKIMVATTIIEVGVNIPNASVMIIENAERFGLSQLHQLRGRVGRGAEQSYCILVTNNKLSEDAKIRINTMVKTNNGFKIAEVDLKLRGPGDLLGTQQSGLIQFKIADLTKDEAILKTSRISAQNILKENCKLDSKKNYIIKKTLSKILKNKPNWSKIG